MTTFIILFMIAILILAGYIAFILIKVGLKTLPTLSDSYYELKAIKDRYKYLFQFTLLSVSFLLVPVMLEFTPEAFKFLAFFTVAPIAFVAVAPRFRAVDNVYGDNEKKVHKTAALVSGISSALWVVAIAATSGWDILLTIPISAFLAYCGYAVSGQKVWWAEMACFAWTLSTAALIIF